MKSLLATALEVQNFCKKNRLKFCIIGGLAVQHWGEPRVTLDVDLTLLTGFQNESKIIDLFLQKFKPRIKDAKNFALTKRVLLLEGKSGVGIDIALGGLPFEIGAVARSKYQSFGGKYKLRIISKDDLLIMKGFAGRDRDIIDIKGIVAKSKGKVNWKLIEENLVPLSELKYDPELFSRFKKLVEDVITKIKN